MNTEKRNILMVDFPLSIQNLNFVPLYSFIEWTSEFHVVLLFW